jgi:hypothetical protein
MMLGFCFEIEKGDVDNLTVVGEKIVHKEKFFSKLFCALFRSLDCWTTFR